MYQPFLLAGAVGAEYDLSKIREVSGNKRLPINTIICAILCHMDLPIPGINELFDFDGRFMVKG